MSRDNDTDNTVEIQNSDAENVRRHISDREISIKVWQGEIKGVKTLIACRSERRAAEILQIPIIKLREWKKTRYASWMKIGQIYQWDPLTDISEGSWEEVK